MRRIHLIVAMLVLESAACRQVFGLDDVGMLAPDAVGATSDVALDVAADGLGVDAMACPIARSLFLNFDGGTLTRATQSDALLNRASWMLVASATVPPYRASDPNRLLDIAQITDGVRVQLSQVPVSVVTTRPATGTYVMIVFGGTASNVGSMFGAATNQLDCGNLVANDVGWIADAVTPNQRAINFTIGAVGFGLGLTATTDMSDCMCGWDNSCLSLGTPCTVSGPIARDPAANSRCTGLVTQDAIATFRGAFCL